MHENKILLLLLLIIIVIVIIITIVIIWKEKFILKFLSFFKKCFEFFWNISEKTRYFNTRSVFYSVNIQPDIMQNWYKNFWDNQKILKWFFEFFLDFVLFFKYYNIYYYKLINITYKWAGPAQLIGSQLGMSGCVGPVRQVLGRSRPNRAFFFSFIFYLFLGWTSPENRVRLR